MKKESAFEYLEDIAELIPAGFFWLDTKWRSIGCNNLTVKGIGALCKSDIIGQTPYEMYKNDIVAKGLQKVLDAVVHTGKNQQTEDLTIDITTGKFKYFSAIRAPLRNKNNEIIGVVGTAIEITEEKEAQKSKFDQILIEQETLRTEVERVRFENKLKQLQCQTLQEERDSQTRITSFVNKMMHEIQAFRIEELHRTTGIKPPISDADRQMKLTKREQQILYFLSMNKSPKDIAQIITIIENNPVSDSTINAIINKRLYPKFEVFNIGQLVEKAIMLDLIPLLLK
ncbi:MAG: Sensory box histidine kinase/response regulator [Burkholderiales bacterium]|jgi:hypothetical protein|nr:Sensory box histidine kinase/response regulator [Burkholderiales bacterium]